MKYFIGIDTYDLDNKRSSVGSICIINENKEIVHLDRVYDKIEFWRKVKDLCKYYNCEIIPETREGRDKIKQFNSSTYQAMKDTVFNINIKFDDKLKEEIKKIFL